MHDSLIRKFCESRHRWLIVATVTTLLGLAVLLPLVDEFFDKKTNRNDLASSVAAARRAAEQLPSFERQAAEIKVKLAALEVRTVDDAGLAKFRSRLVDVVRESGCQIRRIEVSPPTQRPWRDLDNALAEAPTEGAATPFALERRNVVLAVDGAMPAVKELLTRLEKEHTLSHPHRLQLQAVSTTGESVTLEVELWLFALARKAT